MGDVLGGVTDFIGLTDHKGEEEARDMAATQADRAYNLTKEAIEFQREQYEDWKNIYGPLQEDLGTYFKNITGDTITAQQLTEIQKSSQDAQRQTDIALAQRGLTGSGIEAQALMQNKYGTEMQKASVRANADQVAAERKMGFLGLGLGQGTQMLGIQAGVSNTGAQVAGNQASSALKVGSDLSQFNTGATADLYGSILGQSPTSGTIGGSLVSMFSDYRLKDNLQLVKTLKGVNFYTWVWNDIAAKLGLTGESFGVIAQEVSDIIPDSTIEHRGYLAVNYAKVLEYIGEN